MGEARLAEFGFRLPAHQLPLLPFAGPTAIELTHRLYRHPVTGADATHCREIVILPDGVLIPAWGQPVQPVHQVHKPG